jgi:hypothetical protein
VLVAGHEGYKAYFPPRQAPGPRNPAHPPLVATRENIPLSLLSNGLGVSPARVVNWFDEINCLLIYCFSTNLLYIRASESGSPSL